MRTCVISMKNRSFLGIISCLMMSASFGQTKLESTEFRFDELMAFVKKNHPRVQSAQLELTAAEAALLMARGGFDPKLEVDFSKKEFKNTTYYSLLNSTFKVPTWYGVEVKAGFEQADGYYVSPESTTPTMGLASAGLSVSLLQGMWINPRMADLRKAKAGLLMGKAQQKLEAIQVLYEAAVAYFQWKRAHAEKDLYEQYVDRANQRFLGVKMLIAQGDKPAIDSVEAGIALRNRQLSLMEAQIKQTKARLELSNYLWLENRIPLELKEQMVPEMESSFSVENALPIQAVLANDWTPLTHPKIELLQQKRVQLDTDRKLKINQLLPRFDVGYSYLTTPNKPTEVPFSDYKLGVTFSMPLFLRKERGSLRLTRIKLQDNELDTAWEKIQLENKVRAQKNEWNLLKQQRNLYRQLTQDHQRLLQSEERLFAMGESSLFLVNTRENNLITAQLNVQTVDFRYWSMQAELYRSQANP